MKPLLLWDIDGILLSSIEAGIRALATGHHSLDEFTARPPFSPTSATPTPSAV